MPAKLATLDHDNHRFVGALLRANLQADRIPHGFSVEQFRHALIAHGFIAACANQGNSR